MSLLKFLTSAKVEEVQPTAKSGGGLKKERTPDGMAIRLFRNGSVYPSQDLVNKFDLEYKKGKPEKVEIKDKVMEDAAAKGAEVDAPKTKTVFTFEGSQGNGLDLIDSRQWHQFKAEGGALIFVSPVAKEESKVDLFGIVRRDDETGEPTTSVMDQGAATKGEELLQMVKEIYGIDVDEEMDHVDLVVTDTLEGFNVTQAFSQAISLFPKTVARGGDKGKPSYERRDNAKVYALVPVTVLNPAAEVAPMTTKAEPKGVLTV